MTHMEFRKAGFIPFTPRQWEDYKNRVSAIIPSNGISTDDILANPATREFIANYTEKNFVDGETVEKRRLQGITFKLAVMNIDTGGPDPKQFPIVNEYKFHHIYRTNYFSYDGDKIIVRSIDVVPKDIIVPS